MRNVKLTVSYDGTEFCGYQSQIAQRTVEDTIKEPLNRINGKKTKLYCAGRTDTGVHAEMQVVNFFTEKDKLTEYNWIRALNTMMPNDVRITSCEFVDDDFNSRRSALNREYWYHVVNAPYVSALKLRYAAHYPQKELDIELLQRYADVFVGEHDFTSFCSTRDICQSKVRRIKSFKVEKEGEQVIFKIIGNAFLQHMVRTIMGTLLLLHKERRDPAELTKILEGKDRNLAGPTYYPRGLVFKKVYYDNN